jgi:pyruvate,water dikinase
VRLDRWITDNDPSPTYPIYTRANAGEVYPDPVSPLSGSVFLGAGEPGWRDSYCRYCMDVDEFDLSRTEILGCFGGYLYLNMSLTRIFGVRTPGMTPEVVDFQYFGEMPGIPPYEARPGDESAVHSERLQGWLNQLLAADDLPELRQARDEVDRMVEARPELSTLTNEQLVARVRSFLPDFRRLFDLHITISAASGVGAGIVAGVCQELGDPGLTMRLLAGIGDVDSAAPSWAMWEMGRIVAGSPELTEAFDAGVDGLLGRIARLGTADAGAFLSAFDAFVQRFGSRGPNEWELRSPTWGTRPELPLAAIDRMRLAGDHESPQSHKDDRSADADAQAAQVRAALAGNAEALAQFDAGLRSGRLHLAGRERTKTTIIKVVHEMRLALRELGRRLHEAGHLHSIEAVFMCTDRELDELVAYPQAWGPVCEEREREYLELFDLEPPFIVVGSVPPLTEWSRRHERAVAVAGAGDELVGIPGCPGQATGRARVVLDPSNPMALEPGDVLVAPITDPAWTPLFVPAAAVVVDVGAQVSHAVIVSRELGIPCVVSVTDATRRIPDGATVTVDGTAGTVTLV